MSTKSDKILGSLVKAAAIILATTGTGAALDKATELATGKKSNKFTALGTLAGTAISLATGLSDTAEQIAEAGATDGQTI